MKPSAAVRLEPVEGLITQHLGLWSAAIKRRSTAGRGSSNKIELYGIKKLRELILELAVRGLLVPQDPNDEPASELLKRIAAEKAKLVKQGKLKKEKPLLAIDPMEEPTGIPIGWAFARFGNLVSISTGKLDANAAVENGSYLFFTCSQTPSRIDSYAFDTAAVLLAGNGDFNVKFYEGKFEAYQRTYVIEPILWTLKFCFLLVSSQIGEITKNNRGSAVKYLKLGDLTDPVFLLPPLAEQHRIVAKVDELMALCDQLEQQTNASLSAHETLVATLLKTLSSAADHAQFASSWQRIAEHFDTLFTTEESIDQLKQTILQLAVMGKLVPQDPNDEPASELLKRIAAGKAKLVKQGKLKKEKPLLAIDPMEEPTGIPIGWAFARFGNLVSISTGKLDANAAVENGSYLFFTCSQTPSRIDSYAFDTAAVLLAGNGDFNVKFYEGKFEAYQRTYVIEPILWTLKFCFLLVSSQIGEITKNNRGSAVKYLKLGDLTDPVFLLPPLAEQHRIVAKVDELTVLCDQLKSRLRDAQDTRLHLADALAEKALASA